MAESNPILTSIPDNEDYEEEPTHIIETTQLDNDGSPITTRIRTSGIARNVFGEGYVGMVRVSGQPRPRGAAPFSSRAPTGTRYTIPPIIPLLTSPRTPIQQSTPRRTTSVTFNDDGWYDQTEPTDEIVLAQTDKGKGREYQDETNKSDPGDPGDPDDGPPDDDDPPGGGNPPGGNPPIPPRGPSRGGPPIGGPPGGGPPGGGPPGGGSASGLLGPLPFPSNNDTLQLFLQALIGLNNTLSSMKGGETKSKVRAPDVFDGSDRNKLRPFLVTVQLNINDRLQYFDTDEKKISFVLSYLSGRALSWFEPEILNPNLLNPPAWLFSFEKFITELQENFGPFDPIGDAEESLNELRMDNSERVIGYNTKFNAYAALARSSDSSAQDWSCVNRDRAFLEVTLNAAALSLNSLIKSLFTSHPISHSSLELPTLIDSGSSDNFIDSKFVHMHSLSTIKIPPVKLRLLDGSYGSVISEKISLPISFNIGKPLCRDNRYLHHFSHILFIYPTPPLFFIM
ncbi:hypothetical protein D9757_015162 [Collybiopsis confluens]|uniref:Ty3 transposon capsid-like protein domain-containing protein n=1 Tax=Collybiopsis confluens TaxID=2823264 RepID=A0A8H5CUQ7_9AGAR|nr:hypothetical protein D9757_015162 [Collybiopsis confluens]